MSLFIILFFHKKFYKKHLLNIMDRYIGPVTNGIIDAVVKEIKKKKTKEKIKTGIIYPL